jgi:chromosome segregation ATPase
MEDLEKAKQAVRTACRDSAVDLSSDLGDLLDEQDQCTDCYNSRPTHCHDCSVEVTGLRDSIQDLESELEEIKAVNETLVERVADLEDDAMQPGG